MLIVGACSLPVFELSQKYGRGNGDLLQKDLCQPAMPPRTAVVSVWDPVAGHPQLRRRLLNTQGKPGSVSCGVTAPFYWVLVCTRFSLCPPRVSDSPVLWKLWNQIPLAFKVKFPVGFSPFDGWEIFSVAK